MNVLRILTRIVVSVLAVAVSVGALTVLSIQQLVGSPSAAAHTVGAVIDDPASADALGQALVEAITKDNADLANVTASKDDLAAAAARALQASRDQITSAVETGYQAAIDGQATTVDLSGVMGNVLAEMHNVDSTIPATLPKKDDGTTPGIITLKADPDKKIAKASKALGFWWAGLLVSAALLGIVGALSRHGGTRRWRLSGGLLAATSIVWISAGRTGPSSALEKADMGDTQRQVMDGVLRVAEAKFLTVGIIGLVVGAVLVGVSFTRGSDASAAAAAPLPDTQAPDVESHADAAAQADDDVTESSAADGAADEGHDQS